MKSSFSVENKYIWDHWFLKEKEGFYKYFLQAPSYLTRDERHDNSSVGCAFSRDLKSWKYLGAVFKANPEGWYNTSIWTGSIVKSDSRYYMYFTSRDRNEIQEQKIGLIISDSPLFEECKIIYMDRPILTVDSRYYEVNSPDGMTHWRDPFVFEENGLFYLLICARKKRGSINGRGTVAFARSNDLIKWQILPSLELPEWFGYCECPYIYKKNNLYYLHFSAYGFSDKFLNETNNRPIQGDYYLVSEDLKGPYQATNNGPALFGEKSENIFYNTKILCYKNNAYALSWARTDYKDVRALTHISPMEVNYSENGNIILS
ncbi:MAG: family 43 glycosylhydrolase [Kosmotogaceae bacterium]